MYVTRVDINLQIAIWVLPLAEKDSELLCTYYHRLWKTKKNNQQIGRQTEIGRDGLKTIPATRRTSSALPKKLTQKWLDDTNITLVVTVDLQP